jgi:hypothetical protein
LAKSKRWTFNLSIDGIYLCESDTLSELIDYISEPRTRKGVVRIMVLSRGLNVDDRETISFFANNKNGRPAHWKIESIVGAKLKRKQ